MELNLSKRLLSIANLVPKSETVADIGCDHGFLAIYLVKNNYANRALATDVGRGPLMHAIENVKAFGLQDKIDCRLSDGFDKIFPKEADTFVIAGMGGILMKRILESGRDVWKEAKALILSPQRDEKTVREYMSAHSYWETDVSLLEDGKIYTVMRFLPGKKPVKPSEKELIFGLNPGREQIKRFIEQKEKILLALCSTQATWDLEVKKKEIKRLIELAREYDY